MPPPIGAKMKDLAFEKFRSYNVKVPTDWKQPSGDPDAQQYSDAFKPEERSVAPATPPLFFAATPNKYHVDTQKRMNSDIGGYIEKMCMAVCNGWAMYQPTLTFTGLVITGPVGMGGVMVATGPPLGKAIMAAGAPMVGSEAKYTNAICNAIDIGWTTFLLTVKSLGVQFWPMFSAFPSPAAVLIPSPKPVGFGELFSVDTSISAAVLEKAMIGLFADPTALHHKEIFGAVAHAFYETYKDWKDKAKLVGVLGSGPVPTMLVIPTPAPGPVTGGVGMMPPGGLV
jgi:hypothetical protein